MPYIGNDPNTGTLEQNATLMYVATAGQTAFTGADSTGATLNIGVESDARVFMNGVRLDIGDYTISSNTVTLGSAATLSDEIVIDVDKQFLAANNYSKSEVDAKITANDVTDDGNSLLNALIFGG